MRVVTCPSCFNRYTIPAHLMGAAGARVVCPTCRLSFVVDAQGAAVMPVGLRAEALAKEPPAGSPALETPAGARAKEDPRDPLTRLRALEPTTGALRVAALKGTLFSEFGPAVLEAFDAWRIANADADPAAFRDALEWFTGVALSPRPEAAEMTSEPR